MLWIRDSVALTPDATVTRLLRPQGCAATGASSAASRSQAPAIWDQEKSTSSTPLSLQTCQSCFSPQSFARGLIISAPLACALCGCARTCPCAARALHFPIMSWRRESSYLWSAELRESHSRVVRFKAISNAAKTCIINSSVSKSLRDWVTVFFFAPSDYAVGWVTAVMIEELESLCLSSFVWPKIYFTGHLCSISSKSL